MSAGSLTFSCTARNDGNTALSVSDDIDAVTSDRGILLPGETRGVRTEAHPAWPLVVLFPEVTVDAAVPDSTLTAAPVTETVVVWALPWLYLAAAIGLALILSAITAGRRRSRRRLDDLVERTREEGRREAVDVS